jgi:hypothetical protein
MSQRPNAPYNDKIHSDGVTIVYEGHDVSKSDHEHDPKLEDQPDKSALGRLTQNGLFIKAIKDYKRGNKQAELVKAYEKIIPGVWSLKEIFDLIDYKIVNTGKRNVFRFILKLSAKQDSKTKHFELSHTRVIPSEVKNEVWKRDLGKCVICGAQKNLHFDHDLPFSKGGTSLTAQNVKLLCVKHNLQKSDKIE